MFRIEDIHTVLQDADIKNLDETMIEDVLAHHIHFLSEHDVIHFFRFLIQIKDDQEKLNRALSKFENTTVLSFWMGLTRCNVRSIQRCVLDFYSYMMKEHNITEKIRNGTFLLSILDSIQGEVEERICWCECIHDWMRNDVHINGEVLITSNPNETSYCEFLFLMGVNSEDLPQSLSN